MDSEGNPIEVKAPDKTEEAHDETTEIPKDTPKSLEGKEDFLTEPYSISDLFSS